MIEDDGRFGRLFVNEVEGSSISAVVVRVLW